MGNSCFKVRMDDSVCIRTLIFQIRNTTTLLVDGKQPNNTDDTQNGFEIRRAKFGVEGNAFSKELTYRFQLAVDRHNGNPVLEDAWVRYQFADGLSLRGGQFKDPFAHESLMPSRFMAAERTFTNDFFSPGDNYVQGVDLIYERDKVRADVAFTDGSSNGSNQNFEDFPTNHADYGGAGRVEYRAMGDWKDYEEYTAYGIEEPAAGVRRGVGLSGNRRHRRLLADGRRAVRESERHFAVRRALRLVHQKCSRRHRGSRPF